jgi:hypothetical protein
VTDTRPTVADELSRCARRVSEHARRIDASGPVDADASAILQAALERVRDAEARIRQLRARRSS